MELHAKIKQVKPNAKPVTITRYLQNLRKLYKNVVNNHSNMTSFDFISEKQPEITKYLDEKSDNTKKNYLNAMIIALKSYSSPPKRLIEELSDVRDQYNVQYNEKLQTNKWTKNQKKNMITMDDLDRLIKRLENYIKSNKLKKDGIKILIYFVS